MALGEPLGDAADRSLARQVAPLLRVHCMACALHVHCMCTARALRVRCACAARALRVRCACAPRPCPCVLRVRCRWVCCCPRVRRR